MKNYTITEVKFFIGRRELISTIADTLDKDRIIVLIGTAGIGKSTLARRFAAVSAGKYSALQEVNADFATHHTQYIQT